MELWDWMNAASLWVLTRMLERGEKMAGVLKYIWGWVVLPIIVWQFIWVAMDVSTVKIKDWSPRAKRRFVIWLLKGIWHDTKAAMEGTLVDLEAEIMWRAKEHWGF